MCNTALKVVVSAVKKVVVQVMRAHLFFSTLRTHLLTAASTLQLRKQFSLT